MGHPFANAIDPDRDKVISKIYVDVLGSLSTIDAKLIILKRTWDGTALNSFPTYDNPESFKREMERKQLERDAAIEELYGPFASALTERDISICLYNLVRLQIIIEPYNGFSSTLPSFHLISSHHGVDPGKLGAILDDLAEASRTVEIESLVRRYCSNVPTAARLCREVLDKFDFTALGLDFMAAVSD